MPRREYSTSLCRWSVAVLLAGLAGTAQAHPGHGASGLLEGLLHPFGLDHLLAMVAVGIWSVSALPGRKAWQGPAAFLSMLVVGALMGMRGVTMSYLEHSVSLSVALFGVMLILAHRSIPPIVGLVLICAAALLHGLAHGSETPASGFAGYAAGFLLTTAMLHIGGVGIGLAIRRTLAERSNLGLGGLGAALGVAGVYLFGQLAA